MDRSLVEKTCQKCGKSYEVPRRKAGDSRFCSRECMNAASRTHEATPCPVCEAPVTGKGRYCSPEHYQEDRRGKPRNRYSNTGVLLSEWVYGHCQGPDCHNFVARRKSETRTEVYCSRGCFLRTGANRPGNGRPNAEIGERRPANGGYIRVKVARGNGGWRLEHIVKMEELLGRPLTRDENVHHLNGQRDDNTTAGPLVNWRSGNLELWSSSQPKGQAVADKVAWAREILRRYASEP